VIKQQPTKAYPCFPDARPRRKRRRACVHACQRPLAQRCTDAQTPAPMPANGLSSPLHDVKDQATGSTGGASPRRSRLLVPPHQVRAGGEQAGKGFPWAFGARTGQAASHAAAPEGATAMMVGLGRLERPTSRLSGVRSNQLSYRPESHPRTGFERRTGLGLLEGGPRPGGRSGGCAKGRADGDGA
jgi:hypothetical protein